MLKRVLQITGNQVKLSMCYSKYWMSELPRGSRFSQHMGLNTQLDKIRT
jgi:hypothetical protein